MNEISFRCVLQTTKNPTVVQSGIVSLLLWFLYLRSCCKNMQKPHTAPWNTARGPRQTTYKSTCNCFTNYSKWVFFLHAVCVFQMAKTNSNPPSPVDIRKIMLQCKCQQSRHNLLKLHGDQTTVPLRGGGPKNVLYICPGQTCNIENSQNCKKCIQLTLAIIVSKNTKNVWYILGFGTIYFSKIKSKKCTVQKLGRAKN